MKVENAETLFVKNIRADSILELKEGKILFYSFRGCSYINVYKEKTFQKLYEIDLKNIAKKFEKKSNEQNKEKDEYYYFSSNEENISIKEVNEGLILIGFKRYLIEIKLNDKNYEGKVISKIDNNILNINELSDKKIIVITKKDIKIFIKENDKYIFKELYPLKDNWKLKPTPNSDDMEYDDFYQYYSSYILPNDKLLLNSFSTEYSSFTQCATHPAREFFKSKIIFIDLKNFEEITSNEFSRINPKYVISEKYIYIQTFDNILIYDINNLELVENIELKHLYIFINMMNNI